MFITKRQRLILFVVITLWILFSAGFYVWAQRGQLGFRGTTTYLAREQTSVGTIDFSCTVETPIMVDHQSQFSCVATQITGTPTPSSNPIPIGLSMSGDSMTVVPSFQRVLLEPGGAKPFAFSITPKGSGDREIVFGTSIAESPSATRWTLSIELGREGVLLLGLAFAGLATGVIFSFVAVRSEASNAAEEIALIRRRITEAEVKAEQSPEKARFAWDVATARLEAYFDRNLTQVRQIFRLAVSVMTAGFVVVVGGIYVAWTRPNFIAPALVTAGSGIITQFIGATFLVIYRSTIAQANEYMWILERINTVGMAVQILDSIPDDQLELKNSTRAQAVSILLNANLLVKSPQKSKISD